jgi:ABC-2 type transport system permease protein
MLPPFWRQVSLVNPVVYLVSGFRWSFYEHSDVSLATSVIMILSFTIIALLIISWIFRTGYRLRK